MKIKILIGIVLFVVTQNSYSQNMNTEEVMSIDEYASSLDKFDYERYIVNSDINFLKRELGNTGVFWRIENLGKRKYFIVYTVYILPDDRTEITRDLSGRSVMSFEKWKEFEIQNEIKRRENEIKRRELRSSLIQELDELQTKFKPLYEKYIDKINSNNRKLILGYVLGFIESNIFEIHKDNVKKWETSDYKILPNDNFINFIDNPQNIELKSVNGSDYYEFQVDVVMGENTLINLPFIISDINDEWSYLNLQIFNKAFNIDISKNYGYLKSQGLIFEKVKPISKIKNDYKIIEVSYNDFPNSYLKDHLNKLQKSFDKLSFEFNELVSSKLNYFDYGSSNEVWYPSTSNAGGRGFFETVEELKNIAENNKIIELDFNFNPTKDGRLNLNRLNFNNNLGVHLDYLKTRLKNELKLYVENEKVLDKAVSNCSSYMVENYLKYFFDSNNYGGDLFTQNWGVKSFVDNLGYFMDQQPEDFKFFDKIEIVKSKKSYLHFIVENSYGDDMDVHYKKYYKRKNGFNKMNSVQLKFHLNKFEWKIDFKNMKLEHYSFFGFDKNEELLASIDLN